MAIRRRWSFVSCRSLAVTVLMAALSPGAAACGGSSGSSGGGSSTGGTPTGPSGPSTACRTYSTADAMALTTSIGFSGGATRTCNPYNRGTNELTCNMNYSDSRPLAFTNTTVLKFASVTDFVGDAPRVVLFASSAFHPQTVASTTVTSGVSVSTTTAYAYDAQQRLLRLTIQVGGTIDVITFTQWDSFGRPTAATGSTTQYLYSYNDTTRTATITTLSIGGVIVQTFDASGIQIGQVSSTPGGTENQVFTIQSTDTVCR